MHFESYYKLYISGMGVVLPQKPLASRFTVALTSDENLFSVFVVVCAWFRALRMIQIAAFSEKIAIKPESLENTFWSWIDLTVTSNFRSYFVSWSDQSVTPFSQLTHTHTHDHITLNSQQHHVRIYTHTENWEHTMQFRLKIKVFWSIALIYLIPLNKTPK